MAIFIEDNRKELPFEGMLIVLNVPKEGFEQQEYDDLVLEEVKTAHRRGWAVIYLYDPLNMDSIPAYYDNTPEMDFQTICEKAGRQSLTFPLLPEKRMAEFRNMLLTLLQKLPSQGVNFRKNIAGRLVGAAHIGADSVFLPVFDFVLGQQDLIKAIKT